MNTSALVRGEDDPFLPHLVSEIDRSRRVQIAVAFVLESGVHRLAEHLRDLLARGGCLELITGDYLDVTEPNALLSLLDLEGDVRLRVFESRGVGFHPKAYIFERDDGSGVAFVGSSNLSRTALETGVEWNYRIVSSRDEPGFRDVRAAFADLFVHPSTRGLDAAWVEEYRARRQAAAPAAAPREVPAEEVEPPPAPHDVQREALAALAETRRAGNGAGLVVLATGLGKTWLAAFDSAQPAFRRILFVAHREEILAQAMRTFRRIRPDAHLGHYTGMEKVPDADILFASIQTIGRLPHLRVFEPDAFDYIVVDEFHHAAARTYRQLIGYFRPKFLLGLTATPERSDGGDLLSLCDENLVYRCDLSEGIRRGLLSPFHYFGVPDEVDYANIPWRNSRFDDEALTTALATRRRAENALDQLRSRGGIRTLAFCCSQRHADFMAGFLRDAGLRAVAIHAGATTAPRASSLERLSAGDLDVICAVDMFNEGLDMPNVDTIMMLRPTESRVLWLQQFGRGLRKAEGKPRVNVIDYIGNHRTFLIKPQTLFALGPGDGAIAQALDRVQQGTADLPPGCDVTYDLEAVDILRGLLRVPKDDDALRFYYTDFRERHGVRPLASEAYHDGYNPRAARRAYGSWLRFVLAMGDLDEAARGALDQHGEFLDELGVTQMTKSYEMVVLLAMLNADAFPGSLPVDRLAGEVAAIVQRSAALQADFSVDVHDPAELRALLLKQPIEAWTGGYARGARAHFERRGDVFASVFDVKGTTRNALQELTREMAEWRLAEYLERRTPELSGGDVDGEFVCKVSHAGDRPILFLPDRSTHPDLPRGWTPVSVDGAPYEANFVEVALNVVRRAGRGRNELPTILRGWFGQDAGRPGTRHRVALRRTGDRFALTPVGAPGEARQALEHGREYAREEIAPLFGEQFNLGLWQQGVIPLPGNLVLLVTLDKGQHEKSFQYEDRFLSAERFQWQSQNRTTQASKQGQLLRRHEEMGTRVHLFVRATKTSMGRTAPFLYCGELQFEAWEGERPITVTWRLKTPLPARLMARFGMRT